jgi:hypothetical protein
MRLLFIIIFSLFISCSDKNTENMECFNYPSQINELHSVDLYDSARWILFNWLGPKKLDEVYYGQMDLRFKTALAKNDTIEIFFEYYAPDSSTVEKGKSMLAARASVGFSHASKKRLWAFVYPFEDFSDGLEAGDKRLQLPPSDTAIQFIKSHKRILNNCYLQFARDKKIIDD